MEAMQLMPVHRTNMLMQTFNQPKFEVETPVETIETEIISSRRENKRLPFIEANTKEVTIQHLREECVVPVFSKDNEITISHPSFIETVWEAANQIFPNERIEEPAIRVSHVIKGRTPEAIHKPVNQLLESDRTQYFERMMFCFEIPTIHEGVTAQALERKGIISDRCELNRQIRADNALLRELKAEIKKLAALVARTVSAIAEGLEKLRSRVLIFCYQLSHIRSGKSHIQKSLAVWKPELECYTGLVQQIKEKSKERKALITEKKELPIYHVKRHKALVVHIAELTEDLEELRSEKALLLQNFEYAEDVGAEAFRKDIATMEAGLKRLEAQELKYSAELDKALDEYTELKAQAADFDPVELYQARQVLRPAQEKAAERQLEETLQKKPSLIMLLSAKQEVSRLLGEDTEERQARQMVIRRQRSDPQKPKHFQR